MEMIFNKYILLIMLFSLTHCKSVSWEVELETTNGSFQLVNKLKSVKEFDLIFDRKAFSYVCYYGEDVELNGDIPNIEEFKHNQIILENESGQRRLYSNVNFEEDEVKELPDENCMYDWYEYLKLTTRPQFIKINIPYLSDLKVTKDDVKVRMIYIFKPTTEQKIRGYSNLLIKSNWVKLR